MKVDFKVEISKLSPENYVEWNSFVIDHPNATFFHTIKWMEILKEYKFSEPFYLLIYGSNEVLGVLPLHLVNVFPFGKGLTSLSDYDGLLMRSVDMYRDFLLDILRVLEAIIEKHNITFLKLRLRSVSPLNRLIPNYYIKHREYCTFILDLSQGTEHIFKYNLHKKTRNAIRKAIKLGVKVNKKCLNVETYWMMYKETMDRSRGILDDGRINLFRLIWSRLKYGEDFITLTAIFQGKPVAGIMAFLFKDKAYVWYNASISRFLYLNPNQFLYWKLIEELADRGFRYLDFGPTLLNSSEGHYFFKSIRR